MSHYYPEGEKELYYVEFERGSKKGEFTLFKRQWFYSEEELVKMEKENPKDFPMMRMCNEVHPWNLFTSTHGALGCVPDENWVCWMVDCLNIVSQNKDIQDRMWKAKLDTIASNEAKRIADEIDSKILEEMTRNYPLGCELDDVELPPHLAPYLKKESPMQTDGGGIRLVNETELPDYPRDGEKSA